MGLDIYLYDGQTQPEPKSEPKEPFTTCDSTYLRSSYNSGGFNSVSERLTGMDLYDVFQPPSEYGDDNDDYEYGPHYSKEHLQGALLRAKELLEKIKQAPDVDVMSHSSTQIFSTEPNNVSASDALKIYMEEKNGEHLFPAYSNSKGYFSFDKPLEVHAVIKGISATGKPVNHLVHKSNHTQYISIAEIVVSFIEHALELDNPRIFWSA